MTDRHVHIKMYMYNNKS